MSLVKCSIIQSISSVANMLLLNTLLNVNTQIPQTLLVFDLLFMRGYVIISKLRNFLH